MSQRVRWVRPFAVLLVTALIAAAFAGLGGVRVAVADPVENATTGTVGVTASNGFAFSPNSFQQVPTNTTITVVFTDGSDLAHTFSIIGKEGWVIPSTYDATQIDALAYGTTPPALYNANVSTTGQQVTGTFTSPGPGWYEFVCTEPGHFTSGMYGFIAFGMNLPSNLTVSSGVPGPGTVLYVIVGGIVSLVVVALVLGFIVGRRKGSEFEMPPERLGYPEPPGPGASLPSSSDDSHHS